MASDFKTMERVTCEQCEGACTYSFGVRNRDAIAFEEITQQCQACLGVGTVVPETKYIYIKQKK